MSFEAGPDRFALVAGQGAAPLVVSSADWPGVIRGVRDLASDIGRVSGTTPLVSLDNIPPAREIVLIGTLGKSPLVDALAKAGKLDVDRVQGRWETSLLTVVERPSAGVDRALVIAGSDKRGTLYGAYDLSERIGVSPWSYWDDVPARRRQAIYILPGRHSQGEPAVQYRGFFINDEAPALATWEAGAFGPAPNPHFPNGFNHQSSGSFSATPARSRRTSPTASTAWATSTASSPSACAGPATPPLRTTLAFP